MGETVVISVRVPVEVKELIKKYKIDVKKLILEAIREKEEETKKLEEEIYELWEKIKMSTEEIVRIIRETRDER